MDFRFSHSQASLCDGVLVGRDVRKGGEGGGGIPIARPSLGELAELVALEN
jgi:hypothetical protein